MDTPALPMQSGIYAITNTLNGKQYIGSAVNFRVRWAQHRRELLHTRHHSRHLQAAWNKYGAEVFCFSVLEYVADITLLIEREQYHMDIRFAAKGSIEYNSRPRAESNLGWVMTEASRERLRAALTGRVITWRDKLIGRTFSAEHRKRISDYAKTRHLSDEHKARISAKLKGRPKPRRTSEQAREASRRNILATHTPEARAKADASRRNRPPTERQLAYWGRANYRKKREKRERKARAEAKATIRDSLNKVCRMCHQEQPISAYYRNSRSLDGRHAYCKDCCRQYKREH